MFEQFFRDRAVASADFYDTLRLFEVNIFAHSAPDEARGACDSTHFFEALDALHKKFKSVHAVACGVRYEVKNDCTPHENKQKAYII